MQFSSVIHSLIGRMPSGKTIFVDLILVYLILVFICACFLLVLKWLKVFEIKDVKVNNKLSETDTEIYKKSVNFAKTQKKK